MKVADNDETYLAILKAILNGDSKADSNFSIEKCNMYACSGNCIQERSAGFPMFSLIILFTLISLIVLQPRSYNKAR